MLHYVQYPVLNSLSTRNLLSRLTFIPQKMSQLLDSNYILKIIPPSFDPAARHTLAMS